MNAEVVWVVTGVPCALAAAAGFGIASVLQHRAARQAPRRAAARPRLLLDLFHDRRWRWSVALTTVAFGLQITALKLLPLIFVQPLLVTGLLWYVLLSSAIQHRRPDPTMGLGSLGCLAGLSVLLVLARPLPAHEHGISGVGALLLGLSLTAVLAGCLAMAAVVGNRWRSLPLALAAGVCYGVTAGLVRSLAPFFTRGIAVVLAQWQTYAVIVLGVVGVLLSQNAYQVGRLGSPALAVMTVTDPLVSIMVGLIWLGERIQTGPWRVAGQIAALVIVVGCVFILSERAPHVRVPTCPERSAPYPAEPGSEARDQSGG